MQPLEQPFEPVIRTYRAILQDLDGAIAAMQGHGLEALETILSCLDACQRRIAAGGDLLLEMAAPAAAPTRTGEPGCSEGAAEVRRLMTEIIARSGTLQSQIRIPMGALGEELAQINKNRLYLRSLREACEPATPHMHLQA